MGAYAEGLNRYDPLGDPAGHRDGLRHINIVRVSRGESLDNISDGDRNHITVEKTVEVV